MMKWRPRLKVLVDPFWINEWIYIITDYDIKRYVETYL